MTDFVIYPAASSSSGTLYVGRLAALLRRLLDRATIAAGTRQTLDELPDNVLRDLGIARSEIPFAADALASDYAGDALNQALGQRGAATRRLPRVVLFSRQY